MGCSAQIYDPYNLIGLAELYNGFPLDVNLHTTMASKNYMSYLRHFGVLDQDVQKEMRYTVQDWRIQARRRQNFLKYLEDEV